MTVVNMLLRHLRILVALPLVAAVVTLGACLLTPPRYAAESSLMPQMTDVNASRLSGLAQQFGVSMGNARGEPLQLYTTLLESRDLLRAAVLSPYTVPSAEGSSEMIQGSLIDFYQVGEGSSEDAVRRAIGRLSNSIQATPDLASGVITLRTEASSPELAEQINRTLLDLLNRFNLDRRQSQASAEREFIESRMSAARADLRAAEQSYEEFLEQNRRYQQSPELSFEANRLEREVALRQDLYASLAQAYEQARIEEVRNTPVITIIDQPEHSARRAGLGLLVPVALALLFGGMAAVAVVLVTEYLRALRRQNPEEFAEFAERSRDILPEKLRPSSAGESSNKQS